MITDLSMDYVYFSQHFSSFFVSMSEMCCKTLLSAEVFTSHTDYVSMWIGKSQKKVVINCFEDCGRMGWNFDSAQKILSFCVGKMIFLLRFSVPWSTLFFSECTLIESFYCCPSWTRRMTWFIFKNPKLFFFFFFVKVWKAPWSALPNTSSLCRYPFHGSYRLPETIALIFGPYVNIFAFFRYRLPS